MQAKSIQNRLIASPARALPARVDSVKSTQLTNCVEAVKGPRMRRREENRAPYVASCKNWASDEEEKRAPDDETSGRSTYGETRQLMQSTSGEGQRERVLY